MATQPQELMEFTVPNGKASPICFAGSLIGEDIGSDTYDQRMQRWWNIRLYRTKAGQYVLQLSYRNSGKVKREADRDYAFVRASAQDVAADLSAWDPMTGVVGFPPLEQFARGQAQLVERMKARWTSQVQAFLERHADFFSVRVE